MNVISDPLLQSVVALAFAALFGVAAMHKWTAPARIAAALRTYGVPSPWLGVVGMVLPLLESLLCAGLLWPDTRQPAALSAMALLLAYALVLGRAVAQGRPIGDCGCSFGAPQPVQSALVIRNLGLAACVGLLLVPPASRDLGNLDAIIAGAAVAAFAALYGAVSTLLAHQPRTREFGVGAGRAHD